MRTIKTIFITLFFFQAFFLLVPQPTYAYVDPGTGSYVIQLVMAFIFGGLFGIKLYWKKIKTSFTNIFSKDKNVKDES